LPEAVPLQLCQARIQNLQALMPKAMEYRQKFCESAGR